MVASYGIYGGLLVACTALAYFADRTDRKRLLWGIVAALTLVAGLRAESVGIDTVAYIEKFSYIADGFPQYAYGFEASFKWIVRALQWICPHPSFLFTVFALVTNGCIVRGLWDYRRVSDFPVSVACYYMGYFFLSLNGVRQLCAVAILLCATRCLVVKRYFRYLLWVLVASLFHLSGWIGLTFLGGAMLGIGKRSVRSRVLLAAVFALLPVPAYFILCEMERYEGYFEEGAAQLGVMIPLKLAFYVCSLLFVFVLYGATRHFGALGEEGEFERNRVLLVAVLYGVGLLLAFSSYFMPILNRVGWYFMIFEGLYMGMLLKTKHSLHRYVFGWCAVLLIGYGFVHAMVENEQGMMPYLFFWQ